MGYYWFVARHRWACFWRDLPFNLAHMLPRSVALQAYIRVCAQTLDSPPVEFDHVCKTWEKKK